MFRPKTKLSDSVFEATPLSVLIKVLYETKGRKMKKKKKTRYSTSVRTSFITKYSISIILSTTLPF